jgi:hypothetical protein
MAQQTSVEWLVEKLEESGIPLMKDELEIIKQAKEMNKAEMHKCASFWRGKENDIEKTIFEVYYNETFKKD